MSRDQKPTIFVQFGQPGILAPRACPQFGQTMEASDSISTSSASAHDARSSTSLRSFKSYGSLRLRCGRTTATAAQSSRTQPRRSSPSASGLSTKSCSPRSTDSIPPATQRRRLLDMPPILGGYASNLAQRRSCTAYAPPPEDSPPMIVASTDKRNSHPRVDGGEAKGWVEAGTTPCLTAFCAGPAVPTRTAAWRQVLALPPSCARSGARRRRPSQTPAQKHAVGSPILRSGRCH